MRLPPSTALIYYADDDAANCSLRFCISGQYVRSERDRRSFTNNLYGDAGYTTGRGRRRADDGGAPTWATASARYIALLFLRSRLFGGGASQAISLAPRYSPCPCRRFPFFYAGMPAMLLAITVSEASRGPRQLKVDAISRAHFYQFFTAARVSFSFSAGNRITLLAQQGSPYAPLPLLNLLSFFDIIFHRCLIYMLIEFSRCYCSLLLRIISTHIYL